MRKEDNNMPERTRAEKMVRLKTKVWGRPNHRGWVYQAIIYTLLISLGFVYLYPILEMFVTSLLTLTDLLDVSVKWIPTQITLENYKEALEIMHVDQTLVNSVVGAGVPAIAQTLVCSLVGYGLARYDFPFKKVMMVLIILTFVIPPYVLLVPNYVMFSDYGLLGTLKTLIYPAMLGMGKNSAIFILIFMSFFKQTPISLDEAARVDGASEKRIFLGIAVPLAVPAFIMSFVFSFVWYWNDTYFTALYLNGNNIGDTSKVSTMLLELQNFDAIFKTHVQEIAGWSVSNMGGSVANEAIKMAATMITLLPLLVLYFCLQKYFVEGIDRSGITGE